MFSRNKDKPSITGPAITDRRVRKFEQHVVEEIQVTDTPAARAAVKRARTGELRFLAFWIGLWLMLTLAAVFARGLWPGFEAGAYATALEMWTQHHFVVPVLNGEAQTQAPLFFWLTHAAWFAFGVNDVAPRVGAALALLASLFVIQQLAKLLWLREEAIARFVPVIALGTVSLSLLAGVGLTHVWQLFFVLLAIWGLLIYWRRSDMRAWMLTALALAFGVLTTGPFMLVYVVPVALLAPLWARSPSPQWKFWYVDMLKATAFAGVVFSLWLMAAGATAGAAYTRQFLLANLDGPILDIFPGVKVWWAYLAMLPAVFFPWSLLPLAWMRFWYIRREPIDAGFAFCLCWIVATLTLLSFGGIKQPQQLLPLVAPCALIVARLLMADALRRVHEDKAFAGMAIPIVAIGAAVMILPRLVKMHALPELPWNPSPWLGVVIMAVGIVSTWLPMVDVSRRVRDIAILTVVSAVMLSVGLGWHFSANPAPTESVPPATTFIPISNTPPV